MRTIPSDVKAWFGQRLLLRSQRDGIDLSKLSFVPRRWLMPLRRDGLDPVPQLARTREVAPVKRLARLFGMNIWLVTGHTETQAVLADRTRYSNDIRPLVGEVGASDGDIGGLGFTDPPEHTRLRKLLTPEFTMRRLARLTPKIDEIVDHQLDVMEAKGPEVDLVADFAFAVPFLVICELLGLPDESRDEFFALGSARFDVSQGGVGSFGAISDSRVFLMDATKAQRDNPGDGLIGKLIEQVGDEISDYDLGGLADGVFTGGHETTASTIALGAMVLMNDGEARRRLIADATFADAVVEEMLRYLTVVQIAFPRFAKEDHALFGRQIRKGDVVVCSLSGSNRDGRTGADLESFNPHRDWPVSHVAFGHGFHRCVGAELARMELRAAYPKLFQRFPNLRMACSPAELQFRQRSIVYGVERLPVRLYG
ncbi:cytochrome P450 [Mumia flava]|uniref:Cytochrome P450 n=1 Tax=Mumia flava TaxID=1348852 RepID=A0A0B2BCV8_9ACTN|nr:cytochrome P450 [Mumia flava]PJJ57582.1 cytochrome P450 [Mumia flava]